MTSETEFVAELQDPSRRDAAFGKLVKTYQERLYWHIRRIVLTHENADDVLQNTFVKIFNHIGQFNGQSKLYSWMYRIATNEALSYLKKHSKMKGVSDEAMQEQLLEQLKADPYFDGGTIEYQLQRAISALPEKQRMVFNLKYFEEMKYRDMSDMLETSVGALKASYHLATKKIQEYLKEVNA